MLLIATASSAFFIGKNQNAGSITAHISTVPVDAETFVVKSNDDLKDIDLVEMNLLVAKGIPSLAALDTEKYKRRVDEWSGLIRNQLRSDELNYFERTPEKWNNDLHLFRLGCVSKFLIQTAGIKYNSDQTGLKEMLYTNPSDLFINGVIDSGQGTCMNMALLHVAIGQRLGWPVTVACAGSHFVCRFDNGKVIHNIETTETTHGGFGCGSDKDYQTKLNISQKAIACGSDLHALTPRQTIGVFFESRARHFRDSGKLVEAERDLLLARYFFPESRLAYRNSMGISVWRGAQLFDEKELGHPVSLMFWINNTFKNQTSIDNFLKTGRD